MNRRPFARCLKIVVAAVAASFLASCAPGPVQLCKDSVTISCKRVYECYDAATKSSSAFIAAFGASEAECNSKLTSNNCANVTDSNPCGDSSRTFHADKAQACIEDYRKASCQTITQGSFSSANCASRCV